MQQLSISADSWHSKFIMRYSSNHGYDMVRIKDLCTYTRKFLFAVLNCIMLSALVLFLSFCVMDLCIWVFVMIETKNMIAPAFGAIVAISMFGAVSILGVIGCILWTVDAITEKLFPYGHNKVGDTKIVDTGKLVWTGADWVPTTSASFFVLCVVRFKSFFGNMCIPVNVIGTGYDENIFEEEMVDDEF